MAELFLVECLGAAILLDELKLPMCSTTLCYLRVETLLATNSQLWQGNALNIKLHKRWKYDDTLCSGCLVNEDSGEEILRCIFLGENIEKISYGWFYSKLLSEQISAGKIMMKNLKTKDKIVEAIT